MTDDRAVREAVAAASDRARVNVARRIAVLDTATRALVAGRLDETARAAGEWEAHKLAGSAGTFGLSRISELARGLADLLAADAGRPEAAAGLVGVGPAGARPPRLADGGDRFGRTAAELIAAMRQALVEDIAAAAAAPTDRADTRPAVLVAQENVAGAARIGAAVRACGMRPVVVTELTGVPAALGRHRVLAAVIVFPAGPLDVRALRLVEELGATGDGGTLLVAAPNGAIDSRLAILGAGADVILDPRATAEEVADCVVRALDRPVDTPRVVTVTADPDLQTTLRTLLEPDQIRLVPLDDAGLFWDELVASEPDLLIIDRELPMTGGLDLCRLVRADARWRNLAVLILGGGSDRDAARQAFEAGADEHVATPVFGPELLTRVRSRLERLRLQRLIAGTDPLTGLANRRRLEERIDRFLALGRRLGVPLSVAVLNVTGLDEVNQDYGLAVGDAVLRHFASHLERTFRHDRVLARVSAAQFVLARLGSAAPDTAGRLAEAIRRFADAGVALGSETYLRPAVRASVVAYPEDGDDLNALYRRAVHAGLRVGRPDSVRHRFVRAVARTG